MAALERNTAQRRAIRNILIDANRPLSAQELLSKAQRRVPGLGLATVYRTVRGLLDEGWLCAVELPGKPQCYEIAGKAHHHHFSCRGCGRVFELEGCPGDFAALVPAGFTMEDHELYVFGRCRDCR